MLYTERPLNIQAHQFDVDEMDKFFSNNHDKGNLPDWLIESIQNKEIIYEYGSLIFTTFSETMVCNPGDYVALGMNGEVYPYNKEVFEKTYIEFDIDKYE